MSYRNDHDAALARIDALEAELGKNSDAKARFGALEAQLATAKAERDRARAALDEQGGSGSRLIPVMLGGLALVVAAGFALAIHGSTSRREPDPIVAAPTAAVATADADARVAILMGCVKKLDKAVASGRALEPACVTAIQHQAADPTLGDDIHAILGDWYAAETKLATSPGAIAQRDALVSRIHAYVIPSYTR